jgi:hypothetical protein
MQFASPWMFVLFAVIPPLIFLRLRQQRSALRFSSTAEFHRAGTSLRQQLLAVPAICRILALLLLVLALARPQFGIEHVVDVSEGIAIEMVVDRSTSMGEEMSYQGQTLTRLDVVKRVFREFVVGDKKELKGRPNDLVGMISFARFCRYGMSADPFSRYVDGVFEHGGSGARPRRGRHGDRRRYRTRRGALAHCRGIAGQASRRRSPLQHPQ